MKAFWWFKDNSIAGMARPGFNAAKWFDLPFEETLIYGWLGQRTCSTQSVESLWNHFRGYGAKIKGFHGVSDDQFAQICSDFEKPGRFEEIFARVAKRTDCIEHFEIKDDQVSFRLNRSRLATEIEFLKNRGIGSIVTLTENHNQREELGEHFNLLHLAIDDMNAPQLAQAEALAAVIKDARAQGKGVAVHCMAGIGRTSTMLIAAHLLLGEPLEPLLAELRQKNPTYQFMGSQAEFVRSLASRA